MVTQHEGRAGERKKVRDSRSVRERDDGNMSGILRRNRDQKRSLTNYLKAFSLYVPVSTCTYTKRARIKRSKVIFWKCSPTNGQVSYECFLKSNRIYCISKKKKIINANIFLDEMWY